MYMGPSRRLVSRKLWELNILRGLWTFPKGALNVPVLRYLHFGVVSISWLEYHASLSIFLPSSVLP